MEDDRSLDLSLLLRQLGEDVRRCILTTRNPTSDSRVIGFGGGDTIYEIDQKVESVIISSIDKWPDELKPLLLIAEGMGHEGRQLFGNADRSVRYRLLLDPIDGTRELM